MIIQDYIWDTIAKDVKSRKRNVRIFCNLKSGGLNDWKNSLFHSHDSWNFMAHRGIHPGPYKEILGLCIAGKE